MNTRYLVKHQIADIAAVGQYRGRTGHPLYARILERGLREALSHMTEFMLGHQQVPASEIINGTALTWAFEAEGPCVTFVDCWTLMELLAGCARQHRHLTVEN